jgi:hypothetical protein
MVRKTSEKFVKSPKKKEGGEKNMLRLYGIWKIGGRF